MLIASVIVASLSLQVERAAAQQEQESVVARDAASTQVDPSEFALRVLATIDLVLRYHIDPAPRQAMLTEAVRSMFQRARRSTPIGLGRRVSEFDSEEQVFRYLSDAWTGAHPSAIASDEQLQAAAIQGILNCLPEKPPIISPKEAKVQELIRTNRHVGVGIRIGMKKEGDADWPVIISTFPQGPTQRAGGKPGDLILEVDGVSTAGMPLEAVIERLSGEQDSLVTLVVQRDRNSERRTLDVTRDIIAFQSFAGYRRLSDDDWEYQPARGEPIGYLQLLGIRSTTPHELQELATHWESLGIQALVLDLRNMRSLVTSDYQHVVQLADELIGEGQIGFLTESDGLPREFKSGDACLFRDWPVVVLVDHETAGDAELLAAALQDNNRAVIVGDRTHGSAFVHTMLGLPDGIGAVALRTGILSRADGRPLHRDAGSDHDIAVRANATRPPRSSADRIKVQMIAEDPADWGVRPDHSVSLAQDQLRDWTAWRVQQQVGVRPNTPNSPPSDPQLDKALEILRAKLREGADR
jgi:carboxyl-terminal processing protease